jgi:hypothetical protein
MRSNRARVLIAGAAAIIIGICAETAFSVENTPVNIGMEAVSNGSYPFRARTADGAKTEARRLTSAKVKDWNPTVVVAETTVEPVGLQRHSGA